ncbi:MAG: hypothetical protein R2795_07550 [Saprospiraceae bacterium]
MAKGLSLLRNEVWKNANHQKEGLGSLVAEKTESDAVVVRVSTDTIVPFIHNLAYSLPIQKKKIGQLKAGQVILISFDAISNEASLETGESKALWIVRQTSHHKGNLMRTISISDTWRTYHLPFTLTQDVAGDSLAVVIQFGYRPQNFSVKHLAIRVFPEGITDAQLPRPA